MSYWDIVGRLNLRKNTPTIRRRTRGARLTGHSMRLKIEIDLLVAAP
jgi:hypothetical protein